MIFIAMLFLQGQFKVSGRCCQNVGVNQQDTNELIETTSWCPLNQHIGVYRMASTRKIIYRYSKEARKEN